MVVSTAIRIAVEYPVRCWRCNRLLCEHLEVGSLAKWTCRCGFVNIVDKRNEHV